MATEIDEFEFAGRGRKARYPWGDWFNGRIWVLRPGEDFAGAPRAFRTTIYGAAKRHGIVVRTAQVDGTIIVQAGEVGSE